MKANTLTAIATLLLTAAASAAETPEVVTKEATGEAAIVGNDEARALKEAQNQALRQAVEQVAGILISAETVTQNSQLLSDRIFANSTGYVRTWKLLSKKTEKGVVYATVSAEVGAAQLDKDLAAVQGLVRRHGSRSLVILTQEQAIDGKGVVSSSGVMSTVLTESFEKDGWTIIDPAFATGKLKLSSGVALGSTEAKEIGDLTKADYILYGTVSFRYQAPPDVGVNSKGEQIFFPVTGEYDLSFFATDSGSQLSKVSGKFNMVDMKAAKGASAVVSYERTSFDIAKAHGPKVIEEVRKSAMEKMRSAEQNGARVVVNVTGLADYAAVQDFKKAVSGMANVRDVKPGTFGKGKAQFDITFVGSTDDLAGAIGSATFKKKKLSVTGVSANTVEVVVAK
jgi:hypothetical protein